MKWHFSILAAATLALAACGTEGLQEKAINLALGEKQPEKAALFPRFVPLLKAGRGPAIQVHIIGTEIRGGFLREITRGNIESWLGNDGVSLTFDRGVLHGTRGMGAGLLASEVSASANAILAGRTGQVERIHTFLDGDDQAVIRTYTCNIPNNGSEAIQLDNGATSTRRMTESCQNRDQEFTNLYWVDTKRGRIVKSRQWSGEDFGEFAITTVYNF